MMWLLGVVAVVYVLVVLYATKENERMLKRMFKDIRGRKRTYVLTEDGNAFTCSTDSTRNGKR